MRFLGKFILAVIVNAAGLVVARAFIEGFEVTDNIERLGLIALVLTLLNFVVKPLLKLVLGPFIVLSLGIGLLVVNALILWILDFFFTELTIEGALPLLWATLLFTAINIVFHFATRKS